MTEVSSYRVCIIGLGSMGRGVALSCLRAGLKTYGIENNPQRCTNLRHAGAAAVVTCADDLPHYNFDAVLVFVTNSTQIEEALFGQNGLAWRLKRGTPVMISTTQSAENARTQERELATLGLFMLDAPVSGGPAKAEEGTLTVMASGPDDIFEKLRPVLDAIANKVYAIDKKIGVGSTVKIIHQLLAGVHIAAKAEALAMATRAGISLDVMYDVITHAAGKSWMFENRMKHHVVSDDYTPRSSVDIFVKDLGLVIDAGRSLNFPLSLASAAFLMFLSVSRAGYGARDDTAMIRFFSGISLPDQETGSC